MVLTLDWTYDPIRANEIHETLIEICCENSMLDLNLPGVAWSCCQTPQKHMKS